MVIIPLQDFKIFGKVFCAQIMSVHLSSHVFSSVFFNPLVQKPPCEANIACIAQTTFKSVYYILLVYHERLSFLGFRKLSGFLFVKTGWMFLQIFY